MLKAKEIPEMKSLGLREAADRDIDYNEIWE